MLSNKVVHMVIKRHTDKKNSPDGDIVCIYIAVGVSRIGDHPTPLGVSTDQTPGVYSKHPMWYYEHPTV